MKACAYCGAWITDDARVCASCNAIQDPAGTGSGGGGAPTSAPPPPAGGPPPGPPPAARSPEGRVRLLGLLYMILGGLMLLAVAYSFVNVATGQADRALADIERQFGRQVDPRMREMLTWALDLARAPWYMAVNHLVPFALGVVYVWSGSRLRALRGRGPAMAAAILMLVMSPCEGQCCCCMVAMPLGVYALVTLTRGDVVTLLRARAG